MSKPSSVYEAFRRARSVWRDRRGATLAEFGLILPALVAITFAIIEFSLLGFDYIRAGEATRRGARLAAVMAPPVDISGVADSGVSVTCTGAAGGNLTCEGASVASPPLFDAMLAEMQAILPRIGPDNIQLEYSYSGIGDITTPGGIKPFVTVNLTGMTYRMILLGVVPGVGQSMAFPTFTTRQVANGYPA
jgi:hypothetical protein